MNRTQWILKRIRETHNLTDTDIASRLGITQYAVTAWCVKDNIPLHQIKHLQAIGLWVDDTKKED